MPKSVTIGFAALALAGTLTTCGPTFRNHGYAPDDAALGAVVVGVDTRDSVEAAVGQPSTSGVLREDAWYYVEERRRQFGPRAPEPVSREVVAISFAGDGTVANVERFGLRDGRAVPLSRRITETSVRDFGLIQQLLRNFGRIDVGDAIAGDDG